MTVWKAPTATVAAKECGRSSFELRRFGSIASRAVFQRNQPHLVGAEMMRCFGWLAMAICLFSADSWAQSVVWPDLPTNGFMVGRPATRADIASGNAVFSQDGSGQGALPITVPQYVIYKDKEGRRIPMILIQAEKTTIKAAGIVGLRALDGSESVALLEEIELLGTIKPTQ